MMWDEGMAVRENEHCTSCSKNTESTKTAKNCIKTYHNNIQFGYTKRDELSKVISSLILSEC